ncbi:MAG: hypothetical protein CUN55_07360 [Phototrophicales bacterium]|nr:MAG: hypothetical protein CUN55_07360 [Phototrophicales bacterium]
MNIDNVDLRLQQAYHLIQQGLRDEAYLILAPICRQYPNNPDAWWLLAHTLDHLEYVQKALQRVLMIDPFYPQAAERLAQVNQKLTSQRIALSSVEVNPYYIPPSLREEQAPTEVLKHNQQAWLWSLAVLAILVFSVAICSVLVIESQRENSPISEAVSQVMANQGIIPFLGPPVATPDPIQFGDTYWQGIGDGVTMDSQAIDGRYLRFFEFPIKVYVEGAYNQQWQAAVDSAIAEINQHVSIEETFDRSEADVVLQITSQSHVQTKCASYSLTMVVGCASISYQPGILKPIIQGEAYVSTSTNNPTGTILHELLHAIGVAAHSPYPDDIMYFEETNHIITRMSQRDINTLNRLYASPSFND